MTTTANAPDSQPAPTISVVMSVYNGERYLAEAIDSILAQTFRDFEFIIVDDGSTDRSAKIIDYYAQRDPRVRSLRLAVNHGLASALNQGIAAARGEFIARMDSDDVSLPQRFQSQLDYLRAHPDIGVLGSAVHVVDEELQPSYSAEYAPQHALIAFNILTDLKTFCHPTVMLRRELLVTAGAYDDDYHYSQDIQLWSRLASRTRFANLSESLLLYRRHEQASSVKQDSQQRDRGLDARLAALQQLWTDAPEAKLRLLLSLQGGAFLRWREGLGFKRALRRLAQKMVAGGWIEPADKALLYAEIDRRVQLESPHLYRKLRHWIRYRIGRHFQ